MAMILEDIKYFVAISETLNLTRASEIIGISQPALSYAIKRLENQLGGELFIRLKNGMQLTKLGEEFKRRALRLVHEWEQAQNLADPNSGLIHGSYTIAVHPSVALYTLPEFMPKLFEQFPELDFNFIHGLSREMTERVLSWEADFGIVVNPIEHPDLVIRKLCADEVSIFYSKNSLTQNKLIFDKHLAQSQYIRKKLCKKIDFNGVINSSNLEVIAKLASEGFGYAVLPSRVAAQYTNLIQLKDAPIFRDKICLIYRPEKHQNIISKQIIKIIQAEFADQANSNKT